MLIANTITYYNTYINKYIINDPLYQYKNDLMHFYKSFDRIIDKDYKELSDPSPVKPRVSGTILIELYSNLFKYNLLNPDMGNRDQNNNVDLNERVAINDLETELKDLTFNFETNESLSNDSEERKYTTNENYKIRKYIGGDYTQQLTNENIQDIINSSIFMNNNVVNDDTLAKFIANIYPLFPPSIDGNVNYNIDSINYEKYADELKYNINAALCNVYVNQKNPDGSNKNNGVFNYNLRDNRTYIKINDDKTGNWLEGNRSNDISLYEKEYKNAENKHSKIIKENQTIVNNVTNEYMMFIRKMKSLIDTMLMEIERCGSCTSKTNIKDRLNVLLTYSDERVIIIKNKYIKKIYREIVDTFDNINILLTFNRTKRDRNPLTKYIISNFNSIKDDENDFYSNDKFIEIKLNEDSSIPTKATEEIYFKKLNDKITLEKNSN